MSETKKKSARRKPKSSQWSNRIIRTEEVDPRSLLEHPLNFKIHSDMQKDATVSILDHIGWLDQIKVNQTTGFIVDGHIRVVGAIEQNQVTVPVAWLDLSEEEEITALATYDPLGYVYYQADQDRIAELMESINTTTPQIQDMMETWAKDEGLFDRVFGEEMSSSDRDESRDEETPENDEEFLSTSAPLSNVKQVVLLMTPEQYAAFESYLPGLTGHFGADLKQTDVVVCAVHFAWQHLGQNPVGED